MPNRYLSDWTQYRPGRTVGVPNSDPSAQVGQQNAVGRDDETKVDVREDNQIASAVRAIG
jgi:hypothetical protein